MSRACARRGREGVMRRPIAMQRAICFMTTCFIRTPFAFRAVALADEDCTAVHVEYLAGDEAGEGSTEEQNRRGDLVDMRGAAQRDERQQLLGRFGVAKDIGGHFGGDPARGDAVAVDAL